MDKNDLNARGLSRHHIMGAVEQSLQRLQTDYIDLYQVTTYTCKSSDLLIRVTIKWIQISIAFTSPGIRGLLW